MVWVLILGSSPPDGMTGIIDDALHVMYMIASYVAQVTLYLCSLAQSPPRYVTSFAASPNHQSAMCDVCGVHRLTVRAMVAVAMIQ